MTATIHAGDAIKWAWQYEGPRFHALLCDPPYHLHNGMTHPRPDLVDYDSGKGNPYARRQAKLPPGGFMGKDWDGGDVAFRPETWAAFLNIMLPGAFGMAFASDRGWHRLACAIEDAGFVIHPTIFGFSYGSGFPKATRIKNDMELWQGHRYGLQALKPALEPIIVFQRPYEGKPIDCITETGAGALNIDGGRVGTDDDCGRPKGPGGVCNGHYEQITTEGHPSGRWPANFLLLDAAAADALDRQSGEVGGSGGIFNGHAKESGWGMGAAIPNGHKESGASRFFHRVSEQLDEADPVRYCAKASRSERDAGLEGEPMRQAQQGCGGDMPLDDKGRERDRFKVTCHNPHPTVKPIALARYLATLLLPPSEYAPRRLFVPFAGVGSEMIGAHQAGWDIIEGVELEDDSADIGRKRLDYWVSKPVQTELFVKSE